MWHESVRYKNDKRTEWHIPYTNSTQIVATIVFCSYSDPPIQLPLTAVQYHHHVSLLL